MSAACWLLSQYELGEIDVRLNSFRGCVSEQFKSGKESLDAIKAAVKAAPGADNPTLLDDDDDDDNNDSVSEHDEL